MKKKILNLFNIYKGEEKQTLIFAILAFLFSISIMSCFKLSDALFTIHVGTKHLPTVFAYCAIGTMLCSAVLLYAFDSISRFAIFLSLTLFFTLFSASVTYCLYTETATHLPAFWYFYKIFTYIFSVSILNIFWSFIDEYFHLQKAKRIFSLINTMIFIGIACSGIIINFFSLTTLHGIVTLTLLTTAAWLVYISTNYTPIKDESLIIEDSPQENCSTKKKSIFSFLLYAISSPFVIFLLLSDLSLQILTWITNYNLYASFESHFINASDLTQFLGASHFITGFCNIIFGLFLYSRIVKKVGVNNLDLCTPFFYLFIFVGWPLSNSLLFPILSFVAVEGFFHVCDENNFNLLLDAIPNEHKPKIRIAIELFFEPLGMLMSAFLLNYSYVDSKYLALGIAILTVILVALQRTYYVKEIYKNLQKNIKHTHSSDYSSAPCWFSMLPNKDKKNIEEKLFNWLTTKDSDKKLSIIKSFTKTDSLQLISNFPNYFKSIDSITNVHEKAFSPINQLKNTKVKKDIKKNLINIFNNPSISLHHRLLAATSLKKQFPNSFDSICSKVLKKEIEQAYFYFYHSSIIQHQNPGYSFFQLEKLLQDSSDFIIKFAIQLICLQKSIDNPSLFVKALYSENQKTKNYAIETLQRIACKETFNLIEPLITDVPTSIKLKFYKKTPIKTDLKSTFISFMSSSSELDLVIAASFHLALLEKEEQIKNTEKDPSVTNKLESLAKELVAV